MIFALFLSSYSTLNPAIQEYTEAVAPNGCFGYLVRRLVQWWRARRRAERNNELLAITDNKVENLQKVKDLIIAGACAECADQVNTTPLHNAAYHNHNQVAEFLLKQGAAVDAVDINGATPLHVAAEQNRLAVLKVLLKYDASVAVQDTHGRTPFHGAAQKSSLEIVLCLICQSFFYPYWEDAKARRIVQRSSKSKCDALKKLLTALSKLNDASSSAEPIAEKVAIRALIPLVEAWTMDFVADLTALKIQQSLVNAWHKGKTDEGTHLKKLLIGAHCQRHLKKLQEVLALKDINGKTAFDGATLEDRTYASLINIPQLLQDIQRAQKIEDLSNILQAAIAKNMRIRLTGE